ncbi:MAG: PrsW family intramembrane metalloprotease [Candidatus Bathyarchaeota archaeon]|nr:PrsW family intramembrane metalloprotease [Candidatus Bathyarchaeota archaeon]
MGTLQQNEVSVPVHTPDFAEKLFFFLSGIVTSVPLTLFVGTFTDSLCVALPLFYASFCAVAIFAPFVEEFAKAFPLFYRHCETPKSLMMLGFMVGLGFGFTEFLLYVFVLGAPVYVRVPGLFFHAASTSITAYGVATKKPLIYYLGSVLLHFAINFASLFPSLWLIIAIPALILTFWWSWRLYEKASKMSFVT